VVAAAFSGSSGIPVASATRSIGIDQSRRPQQRLQRAACSHQGDVVTPEHRFGKGGAQSAERNSAVAVHGAGHSAEIVRLVMGQAARTEQQGMTGGSIETSVERRDTRRQQLDLGMARTRRISASTRLPCSAMNSRLILWLLIHKA
jgi:hypothetical protein